MSKCRLSITLDRDPPHYRPGDTLKGTLLAEVESDVKVDSLVVSSGWRTHGKGNVDEEEVDSEPFGAKHWSAGERHEFPFSFVMPAGPVSYHGHLLNVDWYVKANADVSWARDPKTEAELLLLPAPPERVPGDGYRKGPHTAARPHILGTASARPPKSDTRLVSLIFVAVALGTTFLALRGKSSLFSLLWMVPFVIVGAIVAYQAWRNTLAKRKLGDVQVSVEPAHAGRGQPVCLKVSLRPERAVSLASVRADLVGRERVVSGSGTNKQTHTHELRRDHFELSGPRDLAGQEELSLEHSLTLPEDAEPTFHSSENHVVWELEFHVDVVRWPDLKDDYEVVVHPS
jgi:hypothetical protein